MLIEALLQSTALCRSVLCRRLSVDQQVLNVNSELGLQEQGEAEAPWGVILIAVSTVRRGGPAESQVAISLACQRLERGALMAVTLPDVVPAVCHSSSQRAVISSGRTAAC